MPRKLQAASKRRESVPGRERYRLAADGEGWLVSRRSHARGWAARVDGREMPVRRANQHLAVAAPAARHDVELVYRPPGLRAGTLLSLLGAMLLGGVWWRGWLRP